MTTISAADTSANQSSGAGGRLVTSDAAIWAAMTTATTVIASTTTVVGLSTLGVPSIELNRFQAAVRVPILASWATTTSS